MADFYNIYIHTHLERGPKRAEEQRQASGPGHEAPPGPPGASEDGHGPEAGLAEAAEQVGTDEALKFGNPHTFAMLRGK